MERVFCIQGIPDGEMLYGSVPLEEIRSRERWKKDLQGEEYETDLFPGAVG